MDLIGNLTGGKGGKGSGNNMVDKVIDTAAVKAKEQIGSMMGGGKKAEQGAKGGIGDMVSGAVGNIAADAAKDSVMDEVTKFGGDLFK